VDFPKHRGTFLGIPSIEGDTPSPVRDARTFTDARLQLHWATQTIVAATDAILERQPDDSQSNLGFDLEPGVVCSRRFPSGWAIGITALLDSDPVVGVVPISKPADGKKFPLHGKTIDDILDWLVRTMPDLKGKSLKLREYDMPDHPVAHGKPFDTRSDREGFEQFWAAFSFGQNCVHRLLRREPLMTETRLWPHHFDWGALIGLHEDTDFASDPSIGVGYSPGDDHAPEPYFYVNAYGTDRPEILPELPCEGYWTQQGISARMLERSCPRDGSVSPFMATDTFLDAAVAACRAILVDN